MVEGSVPHIRAFGDPIESVTDMRECRHGPKRNCHKCMFRELVEALEQEMYWNTITCGECSADSLARHPIMETEYCPHECHPFNRKARAVLEKAKLIDPDCIPARDAPEAAASQDRWR